MRVLLLSYHLLPDQSSEGLCVAKTARALADGGHSVEVVTAVSSPHAMMSGIPVHRVAVTPEQIPPGLKRLQGFSRYAREVKIAKRFWSKIDAAINILLGCTPDDYAWSLAAADKTVALWENGHFDLLYSRLNHFRSHFAALRVKRQLPGVAWCAHFSDPWPGHLYPQDYKHAPTRSGMMERRAEKLLDTILNKAGSVTFPAERLMRLMLSGRRAQHRGKAHVVPHLGHFNVGDDGYQRGDVFTILFTGFLLKQRYPGSFMRALRRFMERVPSAQGKMHVRFIGKHVSLLESDIDAYGLREIVRTEPYADLDQIWPLTCQADVLLLIESSMKEGVFMPSKLADYLSAQRPILALSPEVGTVADYLSEGGGLRVDPDNEDGIFNALCVLFERWQAGCLDSLKPPASLVSRVLPESVVPLYEVAFQQALAATGH